MTLRVLRTDPRAILPARTFAGDAGLDLHALDAVRLEAGARALVRTGIAVEIPYGQAGLLVPRSGLAVQHGIALVNAPGVIDAGYAGEISVLLLNTDVREPVAIASGTRIAQLLIIKVEMLSVVEAHELAPSERGKGGFGSTGQ